MTLLRLILLPLLAMSVTGLLSGTFCLILFPGCVGEMLALIIMVRVLRGSRTWSKLGATFGGCRPKASILGEVPFAPP